jgi:hypothetical protein
MWSYDPNSAGGNECYTPDNDDEFYEDDDEAPLLKGGFKRSKNINSKHTGTKSKPVKFSIVEEEDLDDPRLFDSKTSSNLNSQREKGLKPPKPDPPKPVHFTMSYEEEDDKSNKVNIEDNQHHQKDNSKKSSLLRISHKLWETKLQTPVKCLQYSPDGALFASFCENDQTVRIWYEVKSLNPNLNTNNNGELLSPPKDNVIEYKFISLTHPNIVTNISWRRISKFMPRGMVSNSLITSCEDNICRIWSETILPDDDLLYINQEDNNNGYPSKSARYKGKLLNKLHKMRFVNNLNLKYFSFFHHLLIPSTKKLIHSKTN